MTDKEKEEYLRNLKDSDRARAKVNRMKGLGEMDPEELYETTMNIETRTLKRITLDDLVLADSIFSDLMGEDVEPRRKFIEENARYAELDTWL